MNAVIQGTTSILNPMASPFRINHSRSTLRLSLIVLRCPRNGAKCLRCETEESHFDLNVASRSQL